MSGRPRAVAARSDDYSRHDRRVTNLAFVRQPLARKTSSGGEGNFTRRPGRRARKPPRAEPRTDTGFEDILLHVSASKVFGNESDARCERSPTPRPRRPDDSRQPHRRSARRAIRPTADPSEPRPTTDASIPPSALAQVSDVLSQREGGAGVHPEGARATTFPPYRASPPRRVRGNPRRGSSHPTHAPPPLSPRHDRKLPPTVPPRSRRTQLASAPTISSPSSASRARSASAFFPRRSPSPSSERSLRDPSRGVYNAAASRGISQ